MGLLRSDESLEDDFNPHIEAFIVYQSLVSAPQPICCTSEPTELGCGHSSSFHCKECKVPYPFLSPFPTNGTNKNQQLHHYYPIYARNTVCLPRFPFFILPTILHYCSKLPSSINKELQIRSDRTAIDFHQTDFNDFTGVDISTRCFCLNYNQFFYLQTPSYLIFQPPATTTTLQTALIPTTTLLLWWFFALLLETNLQLLLAHFIF